MTLILPDMFPDMAVDALQAVLDSCNGNVEAAVEVLLGLTSPTSQARAGAPLDASGMGLLDEDTYKDTKFADGDMPLHCAAQNSSSVAVVQALLAAYPEAVKTTTKGGHTPLHIAAQNSSSVAVVQALLAAYPEAAQPHPRARPARGHRPLRGRQILPDAAHQRPQGGHAGRRGRRR